MFLCLDATPLISFNDIKQTDLLGEWLPVAFTSIAVIELELKKRARQNHPTISAPWLWSVPSHPDDTELISELLKRFGKGPPENLGEAQVVASCLRYRWTAVLDDHEGRDAASDNNVPRVYTVTLLAMAAAQGMLNPSKAWKMHKFIEKNRGNFSPLKPDADNKPVFAEFVGRLRKLYLKRDKPDWPMLLSAPGLDDLLLRMLHERKYKP